MTSCFVVLIVLATPALAGWKEGFIQVSDGVRLHYLEAGIGPSILFIPGWTMPADIWEAQINALSKRFRVVAVDPRSQGKSDKPTDGHYPERLAQDIKDVVDGLQLAPVTLVGWSLGVAEVLTYIDEFGTSTVKAVALVDGDIGHDPDPKRTSDLWSRARECQQHRPEWTAKFVRSMFKTPQPEAYLKRIIDSAMAVPTNSAILLVFNTYLSERDWRPMLDKVDRPVLYVVSTTAKDQTDAVKARLQSVRVERFEEAGHALFVDQPDRFNSLIIDFLSASDRQQ